MLLLLGVPHAMAPSSRRPHVGLGQASLELLYVEGKGSVVSRGVCGWGKTDACIMASPIPTARIIGSVRVLLPLVPDLLRHLSTPPHTSTGTTTRTSTTTTFLFSS